MELRHWLREQTRDLSRAVVGFIDDAAKDSVHLVLVPAKEFAQTLHRCSELGLAYDVSQPWTIDQFNRLKENLSFVSLSSYELGNATPEDFAKQLEYYVPIHHERLGVALLDLVGFSAVPESEQLVLLRKLDDLLNIANEASVDPADRHNPFVRSWARASTGDGYFVFPVKPNMTSNTRVLRTLLVFMLEARKRGLVVRGAYTVDECFTFYRYDSAEAELFDPGRPSKTALNLIGNASNILARLLAQMAPNQLLLTDQAVEYLHHQGRQLLETLLSAKEFALLRGDNQRYDHMVARIEDGLGMDIMWDRRLVAIADLIELMFGALRTDTLRDDDTHFNFIPKEGLLLFGKHPDEEYLVHNLFGETSWEDKQLHVGVYEDKTRLFSSIRFL